MNLYGNGSDLLRRVFCWYEEYEESLSAVAELGAELGGQAKV